MNTKTILWASLATLATTAGSAAAQAPQVTIDSSPVQFVGQPPLEQGGRVLVPLRGVLEKLGAYVQYDSRTQTVVALRGATRITLPIGGRQAVVDNRAVSLDVPAQVVNGSTLVPLRFVAESLGAQVTYDAGTNVVAITTNGKAPSAVFGANGSTPPPVVAPPSTPTPTANETALSGTVVSVFSDLNPPRLVVRVPNASGDGSQERTLPLRGDSKIMVRRPDQANRTVALSQIRPDDRVNVILSGDGTVVAVEALRNRAGAANNANKPPVTPTPATPAAEVSSTFRGEFLDFRKLNNDRYLLKMTDNREIEVPGDVTIYYNNQKVGLDDLRSGDNLTIAVDPTTKRGTRIVVAVEK